MSKNSECFFSIAEQPNDFCNSIDPLLKPIHSLFKTIDRAEDLYFDDKLSSFDFNDIQFPENLDYLNQFKKLIDQMDSWFNGWLDLFNSQIEKENNKLFKINLTSESLSFKSQIDIFRFKTEFFKKNVIEQVNLFQNNLKEYEKTINSFNNDVEQKNKSTTFSDIYYALSDVKDSLGLLIDIYEFLRSTATIIRGCCNSDLKIQSKIQLTRLNNPIWVEFKKQTNNTNNDFDNLKYNTTVFEANKNYI